MTVARPLTSANTGPPESPEAAHTAAMSPNVSSSTPGSRLTICTRSVASKVPQV